MQTGTLSKILKADKNKVHQLDVGKWVSQQNDK